MDERREKALRAIRVARGAIIKTAAKWQASGQVDTSPLVEPLAAIQDALAALEACGTRRTRRRRPAATAGTSRRRHPPVETADIVSDPRTGPSRSPAEHDRGPRFSADLRRAFSGLRVSAAAMEGEGDPHRILTWVTLLEQSADRCLAVLDQLARNECPSAPAEMRPLRD